MSIGLMIRNELEKLKIQSAPLEIVSLEKELILGVLFYTLLGANEILMNRIKRCSYWINE